MLFISFCSTQYSLYKGNTMKCRGKITILDIENNNSKFIKSFTWESADTKTSTPKNIVNIKKLIVRKNVVVALKNHHL